MVKTMNKRHYQINIIQHGIVSNKSETGQRLVIITVKEIYIKIWQSGAFTEIFNCRLNL